jgi:hypothetical protein
MIRRLLQAPEPDRHAAATTDTGQQSAGIGADGDDRVRCHRHLVAAFGLADVPAGPARPGLGRVVTRRPRTWPGYEQTSGAAGFGHQFGQPVQGGLQELLAPPVSFLHERLGGVVGHASQDVEAGVFQPLLDVRLR